MQPGMPQGFGVVGRGPTPIFTLPGNPVSAFVSFEVFVRPALREDARPAPQRTPVGRALTAERSGRPGASGQYLRGVLTATVYVAAGRRTGLATSSPRWPRPTP